MKWVVVARSMQEAVVALAVEAHAAVEAATSYQSRLERRVSAAARDRRRCLAFGSIARADQPRHSPSDTCGPDPLLSSTDDPASA